MHLEQNIMICNSLHSPDIQYGMHIYKSTHSRHTLWHAHSPVYHNQGIAKYLVYRRHDIMQILKLHDDM